MYKNVYYSFGSFIFSKTVSQDQFLWIRDYFYQVIFELSSKTLRNAISKTLLRLQNKEYLATIIQKNCVFGP